MSRAALFFCSLVGVLLLWASTDFPTWGDPQSPASQHLSDEMIKGAYPNAKTPNLVAVILADFRNFDTMFEAVVIFVAATAIFVLLRKPLAPLAQRRNRPERGPAVERLARDPILENTCRILFPPIHLFGLYVLIHGHYGPGGGFQAGVVLGASFILLAIGFDLRAALSRMSEVLYERAMSLGVIGYVCFGLLCLAYGGNFLDYAALGKLFPIDPAALRSYGILVVEAFVTLTVGTVIFAIYVNLSSRGNHREGL